MCSDAPDDPAICSVSDDAGAAPAGDIPSECSVAVEGRFHFGHALVQVFG